MQRYGMHIFSFYKLCQPKLADVIYLSTSVAKLSMIFTFITLWVEKGKCTGYSYWFLAIKKYSVTWEPILKYWNDLSKVWFIVGKNKF